MSRIDELKQQLIEVLTEMNKIRPVQFHDIDCDNCVYNFSNVVVDETENRVYVEIAMWHDNLPAHAENPLKDGRGRAILPENKNEVKQESQGIENKKTSESETLRNVKLVKHNHSTGEMTSALIAESIVIKGLVALLAEEHIIDWDIKKNETLDITYECEGIEHTVSVKSKVSDTSEEWFTFKYGDTVIKRSVLDGKNYGPEYWAAKLRAVSRGVSITQSRFFNEIVDFKPNPDVLNKVREAMGKMGGE